MTEKASDPVHSRHTLILESLEESQMGVYTCVAKNNHGEVCNHGDHSRLHNVELHWHNPAVCLDLECSVILPGQ